MEVIHNNGGLITEPFQLVSSFNYYFFTVPYVDNDISPVFAPTERNSFLAVLSLSQEGIFSALVNQHKKKVINPDNITIEFVIRYTECCSQFSYYLASV